MKYFILLNANRILLDGAVICETGLKKLKRLTNEPIEVEETTEFNANSYEYIPATEIDNDPRCGEKNIFYDHLGNEWHN